MNVTLRKADALQKLIQNAINSTNPVPTVVITRFNSATKSIEEARAKFQSDWNKKSELLMVLYEIRELSGNTGAAAGVSSLLAQMAQIDKTIALYLPLASTTDFLPEIQVLRAQQIDLIEDKTVERYASRRESISVSIFDKESVAKYVAQVAALRRERLEISDRLLAINVSTEITLRTDTAGILKQHGII